MTPNPAGRPTCARCEAVVPAGRRAYCSDRCSNTARKARWRRHRAGRAEASVSTGSSDSGASIRQPTDRAATADRAPERTTIDRSPLVTALSVAAAHQRLARATAHADRQSAHLTAAAATATARLAEVSAQLRSVSADARALAVIVQRAVIARRPDAVGTTVRALVDRHLPEGER